ncbi:hypothetical protein HDV00_006958 [Rhizophlyctis rosea]|nr:hypothetical protein HDV00_006958 [Rhizophlyctis rosea]
MLHLSSGLISLILVHLQHLPYQIIQKRHAQLGTTAAILIAFVLCPTAFWLLPTLTNGIWGLTHAIYARFILKTGRTAWEVAMLGWGDLLWEDASFGWWSGEVVETKGMKQRRRMIGPDHIRKARVLRAELMTFVWARLFLHIVSFVCYIGRLGPMSTDIGYTLAVIASGWEAVWVSVDDDTFDLWKRRLRVVQSHIIATTSAWFPPFQPCKLTPETLLPMLNHHIPTSILLPSLSDIITLIHALKTQSFNNLKLRTWIAIDKVSPANAKK